MTAAILGWLVKTITNPTVIVILLVAGLFFGLQMERHKNEMLTTQAHAYQQVIDSQQKAMTIVQNDFTLLSNLSQQKQTVLIKQQSLDDKLKKIPNTSTSHPFVNPDLLNAARIMRDFEQAGSNTNSTSPNN
jgi:predicted negative regulator of RcsB-dependent stress response